jgi:CHAD domain-containing protein
MAHSRQVYQPKKYPEILLNDLVPEAGKKLFNYQLNEVIKNETGTKLGEEIEFLHDFRVATRRLRVAFQLFEAFYDPIIISEIRYGLRKLGKFSGRVRDYDVQLERLNQEMLSISSQKIVYYKFLRNRWKQERQKTRKKMLVFLNAEIYLNLKQRLLDLIETPALNHLAPGDEHYLSNFVPNVMNKTFGEVQSIGETLSDPSVTQLHELRIAFKKFRYTMEFFCNILGDEIFHCIKVIKGIQNYLGEINDLRITLEKLKKHRFRIGTKDSKYNFEKKMYWSEIDTYTKKKRNCFI